MQKKTSSRSKNNFKMPVMGITAIGPRGQMVVPKQVRDALKLKIGDQLMAMAMPDGVLAVFPSRHIDAMLNKLAAAKALMAS